MRYGLGKATRISTESPLSSALLFRLLECHAPFPNLCFGKFSNSPMELLIVRPSISPKHLSQYYFVLVNTGKSLFTSSTDLNKTSSCREYPRSFQDRFDRFPISASPLQWGLVITSNTFFPTSQYVTC